MQCPTHFLSDKLLETVGREQRSVILRRMSSEVSVGIFI